MTHRPQKNFRTRWSARALGTIDPFKTNPWFWFKVWGILVLIIVITCICITIAQQPMDENDFMQYITKRPVLQPKHIPLSNLHLHTQSQADANMYALTHRAIDLSDLSERQLLHLPSPIIPEPNDC